MHTDILLMVINLLTGLFIYHLIIILCFLYNHSVLITPVLSVSFNPANLARQYNMVVVVNVVVVVVVLAVVLTAAVVFVVVAVVLVGSSGGGGVSW